MPDRPPPPPPPAPHSTESAPSNASSTNSRVDRQQAFLQDQSANHANPKCPPNQNPAVRIPNPPAIGNVLNQPPPNRAPIPHTGSAPKLDSATQPAPFNGAGFDADAADKAPRHTRSKSDGAVSTHIINGRSRVPPFRLPPILAACAEGRMGELKAILARGINLHITAPADYPNWGGMNALHIASVRGSAAFVNLLVRAGVRLDATTIFGATALTLAASEGHIDVVDALVRSKAQVDAKDAEGRTALMHAALESNVKCLRVLLRAGADPSTADATGFTALMAASCAGCLEGVQALLGAGANSAARTKDGNNTLFLCAQQGAVDVVDALLKGGAPIDMPGKHTRTALIMAAAHGYAATVGVLMQHGANVSLQDDEGFNALHVAARKGHVSVLEKFSAFKRTGKMLPLDAASSDGSTPLMYAVEKGCLGAAETLLRMGALVNVQRKDGLTALHLAAQAGHLSIIKLLLAGNANVNSRASEGATPLMLAASKGHARCVEALLKYGAQAKLKDGDGACVLHLAAESGSTAVVQLLASTFAKAVCRNKDGMTPLMLAVAKGHVETAAALASSLNDVNHQAADGRTALHIAVQNGHSELVKQLVGAGAAVNGRNQDGLTPLMIAADTRDVNMLKALVKAGAGFQHQANDGSVALHIAARSGQEEVVRYLATEGQGVNLKTKDGSTPLMMACANGNRAAVEVLLELGADILQKDYMGRSCLHHAAQSGDVDTVNLLVSKQCNVNCRRQDGMTPLMIAADEGHDAVVSVLLAAGTDTRRQTNDGRTAMYRAAQAGRENVLKVLIASGCNVNCRAKDGSTPLLIAVMNGHGEAVEALVQSDSPVNHHHPTEDGRVALHLAAHSGNVRILKALLGGGSNANCRSKDGMTPLMMAAAAGQQEAVAVLIEHGADVNRQSADNWTAMHYAANSGCAVAITTLASHRADVNCRTKKDSLTPLMLAAMGGHDESVEVLLNSGADPNQQATDGRSAAHLAAHAGFAPVLKLLVDHGADLKTRSKGGVTPIMAAAAQGYREAITQLIECGASVRQKSMDGRTPLHLAAHWGHVAASEALLAGQAQVDARSRDGATPLMAAAARGHVPVVELLLKAGACVQLQTMDGCTALYLAASAGHAGVTSLLVKHGCDVNACTAQGATPLLAATAKGHEAVVKVLLDLLPSAGNSTADQTGNAKASQNEAQKAASKNITSATPAALSELSKSCVGMPLDLLRLDGSGLHALHLAAQAGHGSLVQMLINAGAPLNQPGGPKRDTTALMLAAQAGHEPVVAMLVRHGADVHHRNTSGATALHLAAHAGHVTCMRCLLQAGAVAQHTDAKGVTCLQVAVAAKQEAAVQLLQQWDVQLNSPAHSKPRRAIVPDKVAPQPVSPSESDDISIACHPLELTESSSISPTTASSCDGHPPYQSLLLEPRTEASVRPPIEVVADRAVTIHARLSHLEQYVSCLAHNATLDDADISHEDKELVNLLGGIPCPVPLPSIIQASIAGCENSVKILLSEGVQVSERDIHGCNAIHYAARHGHVAVVRTLLACGAEADAKCGIAMTPLAYAAAAGHVHVMQVLMCAGADPGHQTRCHGRYVIHHAAVEGCSEALQVLIEAGVSLEQCDDMGCTAVMTAAVKAQFQQAVRVLVQAGAKVNHHRHATLQGQVWFSRMHHQPESRAKGFSLLMGAINWGWARLLQVLLDAGACIYETTSDGCTVLHIAAHAGQVGVLHELVKLYCAAASGGVNVANQRGVTPLMMASQYCKGEVAVSLLLSAGANTKLQDLKGNTALHFAAQAANAEAMKALIGSGAEPSIRNHVGHTPLMVLASIHSSPREQPLWLRGVQSRVVAAARVLFDAGAVADTGDEPSQQLLRLAAFSPLGMQPTPHPDILPQTTSRLFTAPQPTSQSASMQSMQFRSLLERAMAPMKAFDAAVCNADDEAVTLPAGKNPPGAHGVITPHATVISHRAMSHNIIGHSHTSSMQVPGKPRSESISGHAAVNATSSPTTDAATPKGQQHTLDKCATLQCVSPASSTLSALSRDSTDLPSSNSVMSSSTNISDASSLYRPSLTVPPGVSTITVRTNGSRVTKPVYMGKDVRRGFAPATPQQPPAVRKPFRAPSFGHSPAKPMQAPSFSQNAYYKDNSNFLQPTGQPMRNQYRAPPSGGTPHILESNRQGNNHPSCEAADDSTRPGGASPANGSTGMLPKPGTAPAATSHNVTLPRLVARSPSSTAKAAQACSPQPSGSAPNRVLERLAPPPPPPPPALPSLPYQDDQNKREGAYRFTPDRNTTSTNPTPSPALNSTKSPIKTNAMKLTGMSDTQYASNAGGSQSPPTSLEDACKKAAAAVGKALARSSSDNSETNTLWYGSPIPRCSSQSILKVTQTAGTEIS